jgi:Skp family chaperone for outer membrane proteins
MSSYNVYRVGGVALSVLLAAGYAGAQQAPSAQKIGVVDMNRLLSETAVAKQQVDRLNAIQEELRAESEKRQAQLAKLDQQIQQQQDLLAKEQRSLSAQAREQRQQAGAKLLRERESYRQDSEDVVAAIQRRLQREQERSQGEIQEKLTALVQTVGSERGLDLVLDRRACVSVSPAIDLTDEVKRRADAQAPAASAGGPAAKAPTAPPKK